MDTSIIQSEPWQPKLLLVDDEPKNLLALETLLEDLGAVLVTAQSGNEALKHCAREHFSLILMDVQMPDMNGFETSELLRSIDRTRHIPIIFVTAINKESQHIFRGYELGAVDYLFKPLEAHTLISKVKVFIELDRQKQQLARMSHYLEHQVEQLNQEVSERVQAQTALAESNQRIRLLLDSTYEAIYGVDRQGLCIFCNQACIRMLGYESSRQLLDKPVFQLLRQSNLGDFSMAPEYKAISSAQGCHRIGESFSRADGTEFPVEYWCHPIWDDGDIVGVVTTFMDISERLQLEGQLQEYRVGLERKVEERTRELDSARQEAMAFAGRAREASQAKSDFLAMMSHEIRTPLNGIIGMSSFLQDSKLDDQQTDCVQTITNSADTLLAVINDVLDFSKIEAGRLELEKVNFNLYSVLNNIADLLAFSAEEKHLDFCCFLHPAIDPNVVGDPIRISQVLINLTNNAIKFTDTGMVSLRGELDENNLEQMSLRFEVQDTGIGIAPDSVGSLFNAFSQVDSTTCRRFGGTGLGLAISKKLAAMMGGDIQVHSEPDRGSTFSVLLPLEHQAKNSEGRESYRLDMSAVRTLVVDPSLANSANICLQLHHWKGIAQSAQTVASAVKILSDAALSELPYQLVFMDSQLLTEQVQGSEFVRQIKAADARLVLLKPGLVSLAERDDISPYQVLRKPIKQTELFQCCQRLLGGAVEGSQTTSRIRLTSQSNLSVLLAEDNRVNQKVARKMLESLGHSVSVVEHGMAAIEALKSETFDVVLMDCQMPVLSGFEASEVIRSDCRFDSIPIIALTANATNEDRKHCLESGMDDYLAKPVRIEDLNQMLESWQGRKPKIKSSQISTPTVIHKPTGGS